MIIYAFIFTTITQMTIIGTSLIVFHDIEFNWINLTK